MTDESGALRGVLVRASRVIDRLGDCAHGEDCDAADCEDGCCGCPFDEDLDETVHDRKRCTCLIFEAQDMQKEISDALRGIFPASPAPRIEPTETKR